jgi:hypothetical protein
MPVSGMPVTGAPCRILDDAELEGLQWRREATELKINRIFGTGSTQKFPNAFVNREKKDTKDNIKKDK